MKFECLLIGQFVLFYGISNKLRYLMAKHVYIYIYTYIYIKKERDRQTEREKERGRVGRERERINFLICLFVGQLVLFDGISNKLRYLMEKDAYIYIYIYI